jgi:hypothetical protein
MTTTMAEKRRKRRLAPKDKADLTPKQKAQKQHDESDVKIGDMVFFWPEGDGGEGRPVPAIALSDSGTAGVIDLMPVTFRNPKRGVNHYKSDRLNLSPQVRRNGVWAKERLDIIDGE